ncbi:MAG: hypothetical protein M3P32_06670 [Chloroflexota bacterium]|nr:hypothetical protein [Chloroflexota bacterium]
MQLINTDGMTFIGPGSEWFWTALSGIVTVVTLLAIYRQLRLQARASAVEQLTDFRREAYSELMLRYQLDVMVALRDQKDPADVPDAAVLGIGDYWENFAILAQAGHRDTKLLWRSDPSSAQIVWAWLGPWVRKARAESRFGLPSYPGLEWLAGVMAEMDRRAGRPPITPAMVATQTHAWITLHQQLIRYAQTVRTDSAASPEVVPLAQPMDAAPTA